MSEMSPPKAISILDKDEAWFCYPDVPTDLFEFNIMDSDNTRQPMGYNKSYGDTILLGSDRLVGILLELYAASESTKTSYRIVPKKFIVRCLDNDGVLGMAVLRTLYEKQLVVAVRFDSDYLFQLSYRGYELAKALDSMRRLGQLEDLAEIITDTRSFCFIPKNAGMRFFLYN